MSASPDRTPRREPPGSPRIAGVDVGSTTVKAVVVDADGRQRFTSHYSLTYIEAAQLRPDVPRLAPEQREAIDMLMKLAAELSFEMRFQPGDMQLINNHVIYHGRTPFADDAASGQDRLLLRLWLAMPNSRALPEGHEVLWRSIAAGAVRGGIGQG